MSEKPEALNLLADEENASEAVLADGMAPSLDEQTTSQVKKSHRGLVIVLLLATALIGGLAVSGRLQPLYRAFTNWLPGQPVQQAQSEPIAEKLSGLLASIAELRRELHQKAEVQQTQSKPITENLNGLLATIEELRGELRQMTEAQQALRDGLHEQQQMNLQVRLRWISDPASRLPQIKLAWEEISLLPGLTDEARDQSIKMQALARNDMQKLRGWKDALIKWANAMSTPVQADIMPRPQHPWLAWLAGQFHLRQAPAEESRRLSLLRQQLLDAVRLLTLEAWPAMGPWQSLRAELLLHVKALQQKDNKGSAIVELGLPESFAAIQADIKSLRQAAQQWPGEL